ncbi:MAG: metallophosphoesterase family protein [Roseibacillus sp.]
MRTIAIGDIHGCCASLEALAEEAAFSGDDTIVTLGDYVDRGPDSRGVIDFLLQLGKKIKVVSLMGNHEIMMLKARRSEEAFMAWEVSEIGAEQTLASYGAKDLGGVPDEHWEFIESALPFHEIDTHFFVHANALADRPLDEQDDFVRYWEEFRDPPPHDNDKVMVCGHTSQRSGLPLNIGHAVCIDTWAYGDGWLTAFDVTNGAYWQTNEKGERRKDMIDALLKK